MTNHSDEKKEEESSTPTNKMLRGLRSSLGKTPKINNTTASLNPDVNANANANARAAADRNPSNVNNHGNGHNHNRPTNRGKDRLPGVFILMDQMNWGRAAQRAKKYRKECKVSAFVKRKQISNGIVQPSLMRGCSDGSTDLVGSYSAISMNDNGNGINGIKLGNRNSFDPNTHVKCKALHHACDRLRRVHGHMRKLIIEALKMEKEGFHLPSPRVHSNSSNSSTPFFDSFDEAGFHDTSRLSSRSFDTFQEDACASAEWDDPWIEACKAILVIIEQYPEAAGIRESRHGCLPLHLAVFAMGPTPDVLSVERQYCAPGQAADGRHAGAARSHRNQQTFVIPEGLPPSRPLAAVGVGKRGTSNSSAGSCDGMQSLDGFSANMAQELPMGANRTTSSSTSISNGSGLPSLHAFVSRDEDIYDKLEAQLRSSPEAKLSKMDEEKILLSSKNLFAADRAIPRPPALNSYNSDNYRSTSIESQTSTCSNSVMSAASTVHPNIASPRQRQFDLKKYIANEARREEYTLRVLNALLDAYPRGVKMDSEGGRLPLHTAIAGKATLQVIETLTRAFPLGTTYRNNENSLPLHLAACYGVSDPNVAPMLLKVYPEASWGKNRSERTPYHEARLAAGENGREHQFALVKALVKPPDYWRIDGQNAFTNDYLSTDFSGENGNIDHLLRGEFSGIKDRSESDVPQDKTRDSLFALIRERQWDTIVRNIDTLQTQARVCTECEVRGGYSAKVSALYLACEQEPTYEVLDALVNACPGSTTWRKNPGGELPLHAACTWGASKTVVAFLLAAGPDSARIRDGNHNLALHSACYSGAPRNIIESLLITNPKAASVRNMVSLTPRDVVLRLSHRNRKEIHDLIEDVGLEILKKKRQQQQSLKQQTEEQMRRQVGNQKEEERAKSSSVKSTTRKSIFGFSKKEKRNEPVVKEEKAMKERKMCITPTPPPEENVEVEIEEDNNDGNMLWV